VVALLALAFALAFALAGAVTAEGAAAAAAGAGSGVVRELRELYWTVTGVDGGVLYVSVSGDSGGGGGIRSEKEMGIRNRASESELIGRPRWWWWCKTSRRKLGFWL
jgi:uncharacterized membrane protein